MDSDWASGDNESEIGQLRAEMIRVARRWSESDAEDLVQEALARALERRVTFRRSNELRAWMRVVMRNLALDEGRRSKRLRPLDGLSSESPSPESTEVPPVWAELDTAHVRRALSECSSELRAAFELHYWQMLSLDAVASHCGVPRATVGTRLFRARAKVRRVLERELSL